MPPSPIIKVDVDPAKMEALCEQMGLSFVPPVRFITGGANGRLYGTWDTAQKKVAIFANIDVYDFDKLSHVNLELALTLLHELRHAWQEEQHGEGWCAAHVLEAENDAETFARLNVQKWRGVVRVRRTFPSTGFSRLSKSTHVRRIV